MRARLLLLFGLSLLPGPIAAAGTIRVPQDYPSINGAIAAADPGDVVLIAKGTYAENVVVGKSLTLLGKGKAIVDPGGLGTAIRVGAVEGVRLENLVVRNSGAYGIFLDGSTGCTVEDCSISRTAWDGIEVIGDGNELTDNTVTDVDFNGIQVVGSGNRIRRNRVEGAYNCLFIYGAENVAESNVLEDSSGNMLILQSASGNLVADNTLRNSGHHGCDIHGFGNLVIGNAVVGTGFYGMLLAGDANVARENEVRHAANTGIAVTGSGNHVGWNALRGPHGSCGVLLGGFAHACTVQSNDIRNGAEDGIRVDGDDSLVAFNKVRKSGGLDLVDNGKGNSFVANDVKTSNLP